MKTAADHYARAQQLVAIYRQRCELPAAFVAQLEDKDGEELALDHARTWLDRAELRARDAVRWRDLIGAWLVEAAPLSWQARNWLDRTH